MLPRDFILTLASLLRQGLALGWGKKHKEINGLRLKRERIERKKERDEDKGVDRYRMIRLPE